MVAERFRNLNLLVTGESSEKSNFSLEISNEKLKTFEIPIKSLTRLQCFSFSYEEKNRGEFALVKKVCVQSILDQWFEDHVRQHVKKCVTRKLVASHSTRKRNICLTDNIKHCTDLSSFKVSRKFKPNDIIKGYFIEMKNRGWRGKTKTQKITHAHDDHRYS